MSRSCMRFDLRYLLGATRFMKSFTELFMACYIRVYSETLKEKVNSESGWWFLWSQYCLTLQGLLENT